MAQLETRTAHTDNTSIAVCTTACFLKGVYFDIGPGATAQDIWLNFWNVAQGSVTIGTTMPDVVVFCPFSSGQAGKFSYHVTFPTIYFATALTYFISDTAANNTSAATSFGRATVDYIRDLAA